MAGLLDIVFSYLPRYIHINTGVLSHRGGIVLLRGVLSAKTTIWYSFIGRMVGISQKGLQAIDFIAS